MSNEKHDNTELAMEEGYIGLVGDIGILLETARRTSVRAVNSVMTATYWEIGRRIVEFEQHGEFRAGYGEQLLKRLSADLTEQFGRGVSRHNLQRFRTFYRAFPPEKICATLSSKSLVSGDAARAKEMLERQGVR